MEEDGMTIASGRNGRGRLHRAPFGEVPRGQGLSIKVVILAGGLGTRLAEETEVKPKPMVEIGGRPILWHIMKHYDHFGGREFCIALGYKGEIIKRYFLDYNRSNGTMTIDLSTGQVETQDRNG